MLLRQNAVSVQMQLDVTFGRCEHAGQNAKQRRFSRTIRAGHSETFSTFDGRRDASKQNAPTETHTYVTGVEADGRIHVNGPRWVDESTQNRSRENGGAINETRRNKASQDLTICLRTRLARNIHV